MSGRVIRPPSEITAIGMLVVAISPTFAAETFRQLKGREITARFSGMEFTDDVHWALVFEKGGRLASFSMGKASRGTWRVEKDEQCSDTGRGEQCQQVWVSGKSVQLRRPGLDIFEGSVLQKPKARSYPDEQG